MDDPKAEKDWRGMWATSGCNAFTIATFPSLICVVVLTHLG